MSGNKKRVVVLQPRDRTLLGQLSLIKVVDRELAKNIAGFNSTTRANARLLALTEAGLLRRTFIGSVTGGRKAIYRLSKQALREFSADSVGRAEKEHSELFLEHQLKCNEVYALVRQKNPTPFVFDVWINFNGPISKTVPVIPDGYFELSHSSTVKCSFLEVDLGTEALKIWQRKVAGYLKLAVTGEFQELFRGTTFKVLVVAESEKRIENIRRVVAKSTDKIFRFTTFGNINREGFWSPIWQKPMGEDREPLL
jgi:hypothetical protein